MRVRTRFPSIKKYCQYEYFCLNRFGWIHQPGMLSGRLCGRIREKLFYTGCVRYNKAGPPLGKGPWGVNLVEVIIARMPKSGINWIGQLQVH